MHTKIWWSYVHIRYLVHVQKWTYLALGWPYGWALNFKYYVVWCWLISLQLGVVCLERKQLKEAMENFDRALALNPNHVVKLSIFLILAGGMQHLHAWLTT